MDGAGESLFPLEGAHVARSGCKSSERDTRRDDARIGGSSHAEAVQMDVLFSEDQEILRSGVREFLERECGLDTVRMIAEAGKGLPSALWTKLADLGWLG